MMIVEWHKWQLPQNYVCISLRPWGIIKAIVFDAKIYIYRQLCLKEKKSWCAWLYVLSIWAACLLYIRSLFITLSYANLMLSKGWDVVLTECDQKWGVGCSMTLWPGRLIYVETFQCYQHRPGHKRQTRSSTGRQMVQILPKPKLQIQRCESAQHDSTLVRIYNAQDTRSKAACRTGFEYWSEK